MQTAGGVLVAVLSQLHAHRQVPVDDGIRLAAQGAGRLAQQVPRAGPVLPVPTRSFLRVQVVLSMLRALWWLPLAVCRSRTAAVCSACCP